MKFNVRFQAFNCISTPPKSINEAFVKSPVSPNNSIVKPKNYYSVPCEMIGKDKKSLVTTTHFFVSTP
ncbi:hypothetical protein [Dyadobacter sp. BHUBP1]|uniref:hypothetical protein n=1 Tax=Dyadobacter sp. BHUBP1 TaxID=3424178 RepID=UPI003D337519